MHGRISIENFFRNPVHAKIPSPKEEGMKNDEIQDPMKAFTPEQGIQQSCPVGYHSTNSACPYEPSLLGRTTMRKKNRNPHRVASRFLSPGCRSIKIFTSSYLESSYLIPRLEQTTAYPHREAKGHRKNLFALAHISQIFIPRIKFG